MSIRETQRILMGHSRGGRPIVIEFSAKAVFAILGLIGVCWSWAFWYGIELTLYSGQVIPALAISFMIALGAPALLSWLVPWSAGGMLYQKTTARTWGFLLVAACALYYLYYCFQLLYSWNAAQPVVAESNIIYQQVIVQMIAYIGIPALVFTPVTSGDLVAAVEQAQFVKRYELAADGEIAVIEAQVQRAAELAFIGAAERTAEENEELAGIFGALLSVQRISLSNLGDLVKRVSGVRIPRLNDEGTGDVEEVLEYVAGALTGEIDPATAERGAMPAYQRVKEQERKRLARPTRQLSTDDREYEGYQRRERRQPEYRGRRR